MICLWISIVIGFVNDFVIERFGKERAGLWARSGLRDSFFYFGKIALVPGRELPGQIDKAHLSRMLNPVENRDKCPLATGTKGQFCTSEYKKMYR